MLRFIFNLLRAALVTTLAAALGAKLLLESNAEPNTEEIDLVSIFEGKHLISEAAPFYGGKILAMFGGVLLDLRKTTPAPTGVDIDLAVVAGGVSVVVPEGWRVRFQGRTVLGGWADDTKTTAEGDTPRVNITGYVVLGGLQVTTESPAEMGSEATV